MTFGPFLLLWLVAGGALGAAYLYLISRSVAEFGSGRGWVAATWPVALRLGLAIAVLLLASRQGPAEVLATLAGFLVLRLIILRRVRER